MGVVYLARDPQIERTLALKTVRFDGPSQSFSISEAKARFLKEAKISGRLQHPNIVTVFDVGEDEGVLYLAMEYISGGALNQRLTDGLEFPIPERIRILSEVADALAHAHQRGVIHRDVKPANILLTEASVAKVTDFGIGKLLTGDTDLTSTGQMVGSPAYMSPEQIRGDKLDVRSDIFSLGVVLYQTLTLKKPFPADTLTTLVYQILNNEPDDPLVHNGELPPEITEIALKCLAKDREAALRRRGGAGRRPPRRHRDRPARVDLGAHREQGRPGDESWPPPPRLSPPRPCRCRREPPLAGSPAPRSRQPAALWPTSPRPGE